MQQHPLTLRFNDRELESLYRYQRLQGFFRTLDTRYLAAQAVLAAVFFLVQPLLFPSIEFHWANVAYPAVCIINWLLTSRLLPRAWYERHRHALQLGFRALVDSVVIWGLPAWSPPVPVRSLGTFLSHLVLTSGAGTLIWASIGWPLLLQHHIPYNLAAATAFSLLVAPHVCAVIRQNALGGAYMRSSWAALSRLGVLSSQLRALLVTQLSSAAAATVALDSAGPGGGGGRGDGSGGGSDAASCASGAASAGCGVSGSGYGYGAHEAEAGHGYVLGPALGVSGSNGIGGVGGMGGGGGWQAAALVDAPAVALVQSAGEEGMCLATVTLAQVLFGFVFPTILVYVLEGYSRDYFQRSVACGGSDASGGRSSGGRSSGGRSSRGRRSSAGGASGRSSGDSGGVPGAVVGLEGEATAGTAAGEAVVEHAAAASEEPSSYLQTQTLRAPPPPPPALSLMHLSSSERWLCSALDWVQRALCGFMLVLLVLMLWELLLYLRFLLLPQLLLRVSDAAAAAAAVAGSDGRVGIPLGGAMPSAGLSAVDSAGAEASALASAAAAAAEAVVEAVAAAAKEL